MNDRYLVMTRLPLKTSKNGFLSTLIIYIKRPQFENYGLIFCPNVNHLELLFNLFFLANVPVLIPVTVFNPL
ncbi:Uncharacterised protein [Streptococcus pneumoniae]|nr:Uncharacterised protein [Streptococcus pneumoniae]